MDVTVEQLRKAGDAFAVFAMPRAFAMDRGTLESRHAALTRLTHPDLAGDEPEAQVEALELSARVNNAYKILADDEERGNLLLELLGGPTREADKSLPDGFLPEIMMLREELAEAQLEGEDDRVAALESDARASRAAHLQEIGRLFATETPDLPAIRMELNVLRYFQRLLEQVHPTGEPRM